VEAPDTTYRRDEMKAGEIKWEMALAGDDADVVVSVGGSPVTTPILRVEAHLVEGKLVIVIVTDDPQEVL
jgi:hypothetical protein